MSNTSAHNPMSYLSNVSPILQACGNGDKQYDTNGNVDTTLSILPGGCTCTDPSYQYSNICKIQGLSNPSGRSRCAFKAPTQGGPGINPSFGGSFAQVQNLTYNITPNGGGSTPFYKTSGPASGIPGIVKTYPSSLLFCANPATGGDASPNLPTNNITPGASGGLNTSKWTKSNPNTGATANIGFE